MEPYLAINDKKMFYKYLDNCKIYFEYGSGGSTYQASIRNNIKKIYSVESDKKWFKIVEKNIKSKNLTYFYNEMNVLPNNWGQPGPNSTHIQHKNYSNFIKKLNKEEQKNIDLILIDGRFRVACCLKCFDIINNNCLIVFDDFLNRQHYHIVLNYYDIVNKTIDERMVILKKKKTIKTIPKELILEYELIPI
jgi:16S rRNA G966 N2-methylase RsmD